MDILSTRATAVIDRLQENGFEAFAVGGCVRDILMDIKAHDYDITTNATTDEVLSVFSNCTTVPTGIKHGTITVIYENEPFEITTYRKELGYSDNRHPDKVIFSSSIEDDLSRRDFTVNSIAYNSKNGFVDCFGGQEDIKRKIIRCVGEPSQRFCEDALRILRGLRFSSVLGFEIEESTKKAMSEHAHLIEKISKERCFSEFSKLLCGKNVKAVLMENTDILRFIVPEITQMQGFDQHNFHHIYDVLEHTATAVESIPPVLHLRLAAFFHDIAKPSCFTLDENGVGHFYSHAKKSAVIAQKRLDDLRCDNKTKEAVIKLIKAHDNPIEENEKIIKRRLAALGEDLFFDLIRLKRADTAALNPRFFDRSKHFDRIEEIAKSIIEKDSCFSLNHLAVNGNDMLELGFKGKEIGKALDYLLEAVIDGQCENSKNELIKLIKTKKE